MQHGSNPILNTLEPVGKGYPQSLKIYKVLCSPFYYTRVWLDGRMIPRSTKTRNKDEAKKFAGNFYDELLLKRAKKEPLVGGEFKQVANATLEEDREKVIRGERKESLVIDGKYIIEHLVRFFKNDQLKNIDYERICAYVEDMKTRGKKRPGAATIKNHLGWLSKIFTKAVQLKKLDQLPVFPTITRKDSPREWFSGPQYSHLLKTVNECVGYTVKKTYHPITLELRMVCTFLVNTFLRPPDLKTLKNKDITVGQNAGSENSYLRIHARSKVKASAVISMPLGVKVYEQLTEFNKALGFGKPDDYVFFPGFTNRGYAIQTMRLQFNYVLDKADLKIGEDGKPRTLYCLRHSSIMFRLLNGGPNVDIFLVARNARTSVEIVEKYYASRLEAEMKVNDLHHQGARQIGREL